MVSNRKKVERACTTDRQRAKLYGCAYQTISKVSVFERDGWACYLCGDPTPRELKGTRNPKAPEIDHVVPMVRGGSHTYENVRCVCKSCNRAKSDMTLDDFLAKRAQRTLATGSHSP
jgi:5-methylcytosine-specific restriction endonuclease McrA